MFIQGNVEQVRFGVDVNSNGVITGNQMTFTPESVINFLERLSLIYGDIVGSSMGLVSFGSVGTNSKVKFAQLTSATGHMLRPRGNTGCIWNPVGNISMRTSEFEVYPFKYQGQMCPDMLWGTCLEKMMGVGNNIIDLMGNPESRAIVMKLIQSIYESLGNSIWDLAWFAENPIITEADTANTYTVDEEEWANLKAQQLGVGMAGWITSFEGLKTEGRENYNVEIPAAAVADNNDFIGNVGGAGGLFERTLKRSSKTMKTLNSRTIQGAVTGATVGKHVFLVTKEIFEAYERELNAQWGNIPQSFYYHITGQFANEFGLTDIINPKAPLTGVLMWKGHLVRMMENWNYFYDMCGYDAHICMMAAPGVLGLAVDVQSLEQYKGLGMVIEQKMAAPDLGKIYLYTNLRMGTGIVNEDLVTYGSVILPKNA